MTAVQPDEVLPTIEELTVPELNVSSPVLKAGAHHFGRFCDFQSKDFMLCMQEEMDPRKCIKEGAEVTSCAYRYFNLIRANCMKEFTDYWKCVDHAGQRMYIDQCRKTQKPFDQCVFDKLGWVRPEKGYFAKIRLHETQRKKPELHIDVKDIPEWTPGPRNELNEDKPEDEDCGRFIRRDQRRFGLV